MCCNGKRVACVATARARMVCVNHRQGDVRVSDALTGVEEEKDVVMRISATSCFSPSKATCIGVCPFLFWEDKDTYASHEVFLHVPHRQSTCRCHAQYVA
jgi:hypothetical protein